MQVERKITKYERKNEHSDFMLQNKNNSEEYTTIEQSQYPVGVNSPAFKSSGIIFLLYW